MTKKHWISVKRGLSEDPKHREKMGMAIWAFLHMIDRADWETGLVYDWRDKDEAHDMALNPRTMRDWRQHLIDAGYIACKQGRRGLEITIFNWINPRDYGAGVLNPKHEGDTRGDILVSPCGIEGDTQGDTQGDTEVGSESVTLPLDSKVKSHKSKREGASAAPTPTRPSQLPEIMLYREVTGQYPAKASMETVLLGVTKVQKRLGRIALGADLLPFYQAWCNRGYNPRAVTWLEWAVSGNVPTNGNKPSNYDHNMRILQDFAERKSNGDDE